MKKLLVLLSCVLALSLACTSAKVEKVTLRINTWENPATVSALEALNAKFMEKYPNITIELTHSPTDKYQQENPVRVKAGDVDIWSDFGFANPLQPYHTGIDLPLVYQNIESGLVLALEGQDFIKNYKPDAVKDAMTYKGKVYGICMGSVVFSGIFYNKDLFTKFGIAVPTTYRELIAACDAFKAKKIAPFTAAGKPVWPIAMMRYGFMGPLLKDFEAFEKELWTGGPGWKNPLYIESLNRYQKLLLNYYEDGFQALDYNPHIARFISGKAAMLPDGIWQAASIAEQGGEQFHFGYLPIPAGDAAEDNKVFYGKYDLMWQVHAKSKVQAQALQWLAFISEQENYLSFINKVGWLPTQPNVQVSNPILLEVSKAPLKLAFEQLHVSREGQGQYADGSITWLTPMGTVKTVAEFVELAQKDWDSAVKK